MGGGEGEEEGLKKGKVKGKWGWGLKKVEWGGRRRRQVISEREIL